MTPLGDGDLNLPFEEQPLSYGTLGEEAHVSGGVVVLGAVVDVDGKRPTLLFRFAKPDGSGFYPPIALVCDVDDLTGIPKLVNDATKAAIKAARKAA